MKVLVAGDFVPHGRVATQIDSGDYSCLNMVKPFADEADYTILNFECPIASRNINPIKKTGPALHCTEKAMECIVQAGFKCVTLANNHFRDFGQEGVDYTIDVCEKYRIDYVGGGKTLADAQRVHYKKIAGQCLAIINVCEHEWSIATEEYGGSNPLDIVATYYAIQEAKSKADIVMVIVHGGHELWQFPSPRMKKLYRFFIDTGADTVVNHHQHCYSGYEVYKEKPIFYGLGNFCFDKGLKRSELWELGYMVMLHFDKEMSFDVIPYRQCGASTLVNELSEEERTIFSSNIEKLNCVIADDKKLQLEFIDYLRKKSKGFRFVITPYRNKFFTYLFNKGVLPSFFPRKNYLLLKEMFTCESHYDTFLYFLNKQIEKT